MAVKVTHVVGKGKWTEVCAVVATEIMNRQIKSAAWRHLHVIFSCVMLQFKTVHVRGEDRIKNTISLLPQIKGGLFIAFRMLQESNLTLKQFGKITSNWLLCCFLCRGTQRSDKNWIDMMSSGARDIIFHMLNVRKREKQTSQCEILTLLHVHMLRICWWHIAEHAHLGLFIMSRRFNPLLQPLSWREGEKREGIRYSLPGLIESQLSEEPVAARCKVKAMLILPLWMPLMNNLHAHSRRPGDAETSSTFRFNPLGVISSLETHAPAAALLFYVSFTDSSTNSQTDTFWVSSKDVALPSFHQSFLLTDCRLLVPLHPRHMTALMNPVIYRLPIMQQKGNSLQKKKRGMTHLMVKTFTVKNKWK